VPPGTTSNVSGNILTGNHGPIAYNDEDFDATSSGECPDEFNFSGQLDLPSNVKLTYFIHSSSNKNFPSINDFSAGNFQIPELHGQQQVQLQGILHEQVNLENPDIASADDLALGIVLRIKPCLSFGNFMFGNHDDLFIQP